MSHIMRKPVFRFLIRSDTNRAVQLQKMVRGLKFPGHRADDLHLCFCTLEKQFGLLTRLKYYQRAQCNCFFCGQFFQFLSKDFDKD